MVLNRRNQRGDDAVYGRILYGVSMIVSLLALALAGSPDAGINLSAMFGGDGQAAWISGACFAEPTDNLAPRSSQFAGVVDHGRLVSSGRARGQFTVQGGQPAPGAPVYLAACTDDDGGCGKLTATRPSIATLGRPDLFVGTRPSSVTRIGIALDCSAYAASKTCAVELGGPASPELPQETDQEFTGYLGGPYDNSDFWTAPYNATGATFNQGETLVVGFTVDNYTGTGWLVGNVTTSLGFGWFVQMATDVILYQTNLWTFSTLDLQKNAGGR